MKTILLSLCSIIVLVLFYLLFSQLLKQSRTKSSMYTHKSELPQEPQSWVMKDGKLKQEEAAISWEELEESQN